MKLVKKNFWVVAILFAIILTACGSRKDKPADLFTETYNNMKNQTNYRVEMKMNVGSGEAVETTIMTFGFNLESRTKGVVKVDTTLLGIDHQGYREFNDTEILSYTNIPGTGSWVKKTITMDDFNTKDINNENYFSILTNNTKQELLNNVKVDDIDCKVYSLTVNNSGILSDLFTENEQKVIYTAYGLTKEEFDVYFNEVIFEVTIDSENKLVRNMKVDLSDVFAKLAADYQEKNGSAPRITYDEVYLEMAFTDFEEVEVTIPSEVKDNAIAK